MKKLKNQLKNLFFGLLRLELINKLVFKIRFLYYVYLCRRFDVYQDENSVIRNDYSIQMLKRGITSNRVLKFIRPLSVVESVNKDGQTLAIGCRFETELLYLMAYGFNPKGIRGLDMISYSPWIDLGNMHKMKYADSTFDTITMGWLISYSETPEVAAREIVRVIKPGGVVALAVAYYPQEKLQEVLEKGTYVADPRTRIQTTEGLLKIFGSHVDQVYFQHMPPAHKEGATTVIFSVKK
jgi:SAM-dependent methyltransferase